MTTGKPAKPSGRPSIIGAFMDFLILVLVVGAAGGGGYYWGTQQRMAPVKSVAPGTPGALPADSLNPAATKSNSPDASKGGDPARTSVASSEPDKTDPPKDKDQDNSKDRASSTSGKNASEEKTTSAPKAGGTKYWICSSGTDYIGSSVTVSVNDTPVDSFFGPGKFIDLTKLVKKGDNEIKFEAKALGQGYNKHKGDSKAVLTLQLVSGPQITPDSFKKSDVICTFKRNAAETDDAEKTEEFTKD